MLRALLTVLATLLAGICLMVVCFLLLCMNVLTLPVFLFSWVACRMLHLQTPRPAWYGLMLYPSWKKAGRRHFLSDVSRYCRFQERCALHKAAQRPVRAWEERFF